MRHHAFSTLHLALRIGTMTVGLLLICAVVAMDLSFGRLLIGDIVVPDSAQLLTRLDAMAFSRAKSERQDREGRPYFPNNERNPFVSTTPPSTLAPPSPTSSAPAGIAPRPQVQ